MPVALREKGVRTVMTRRLLDHLVLPTADLQAARQRLTSLGFTVAPDGRHPFGTANCCVYLADGTFIEPLAVADAGEGKAAIAANNVFVGRDAAYRASMGEEGFSALVCKTDDARADHAAFVDRGISGGPVLDFERPSRDADGKADVAAFRLAFAADSMSPASFFFTCQRVRSPQIDRSALERHRNGARRIVRIEASAVDPQKHMDFLVALLGPSSGAFDWKLGNADFTVLPRDADDGSGLRLSTIVFGVQELVASAALFNAGAIAYEVAGNTLVVRPAPGQGATFIFEEI